MRSVLRLRGGWFGRAAGASIVCALWGCSGAEVGPSTTPAEPSAAEQLLEVLSAVDQACPSFAGVESASGGRDEIFVEAVVVEVTRELAEQASLKNLAELGRSPRARLVAAPHVVGAFDTKSELALEQVPDASAPTTLARWSMLPRHVDARVSSLELDLELSWLEPNGQVTPSRPLRFSVTTRDNEPGLARIEWPERNQRALVIVFRTFRIQEESDLRAIFECKMHQREQHLQRAHARRR
jgi:hypothetical protein